VTGDECIDWDEGKLKKLGLGQGKVIEKTIYRVANV